MSNARDRMTSNQQEEDWDWEEVSEEQRTGAASDEQGDTDAANKNLRPSAPAFVPRPPAPSARPAGTNARPLGAPLAHSSRAAGNDEDDWFGPRRPVQTNRQLWDSANAPKPQILAPVPTQGSMPTNQVKILRREPGGPSKKSPGPSASAQKSLSEREEEYRLARERIFGKEPEQPAVSPKPGNGRRSGKNSPVDKGDRGERGLGPVPVQVKRSSAPPSRESTPIGVRTGNVGFSGAGANGAAGIAADGFARGVTPSSSSRGGLGGRTGDQGVIRQPKGPGSGGGFGR